MPFVLVRHKIADFERWKPFYDAHRTARDAAGLEEVYLFRTLDDPNVVAMLFEVEDIARAKAFMASDDLRLVMQKAGASSRLDVIWLDEVEAPSSTGKARPETQPSVH